MMWNNTVRRLTALAAALVILLSLGAALAQQPEEEEEQGLFSFTAKLIRGTFVEKAIRTAAKVIPMEEIADDADMEEQGLFDSIKNSLSNAWDKTKEVASSAGKAVKGFFTDLGDYVVDGFKNGDWRDLIPGHTLDKFNTPPPPPPAPTPKPWWAA